MRHWPPPVGLYVTVTIVSGFQEGELVESTFQAIVVPGPLYSVTRLLQPGMSKLKVPLMDNIVTVSNSVMAKVGLGRRDGWKGIGRGEGRELSVYSATLRGALRYHGIRFVPIYSRLRVCAQNGTRLEELCRGSPCFLVSPPEPRSFSSLARASPPCFYPWYTGQVTHCPRTTHPSDPSSHRGVNLNLLARRSQGVGCGTRMMKGS